MGNTPADHPAPPTTPAELSSDRSAVQPVPLERRLSGGPISVLEATVIIRRLAGHLSALHDAGQVHGDIHADTVRLTRDGVQVLPAAPEPRYPTPELLAGQTIDRRADVFAVGCLLYQCVAGCHPFAAGSADDIRQAVRERSMDVDALPRTVPEEFRRIILRCLAKNRDERTRDLRWLLADLEPFAIVRDERGCEQSADVPLAALAQPRHPPGQAAPARQGDGGGSDRWRSSGVASTAIIIGATALLAGGAGALITRAVLRPPRPQPVTHVIVSPPTTMPAPAIGRPPITRPTEAGPVERFALALPAGAGKGGLSIAASRGGETIVVGPADDAASAGLFVRRQGDLGFSPLDGSAGAGRPGIAPDGRHLVGIHDGRAMRWPIGGGPGRPLAPDATAASGATLLDANTAVVAVADGTLAIYRGGKASGIAFRPRAAAGELALLHPRATPDGGAITYTVRMTDGSTRVELRLLDGTGATMLATDASHGRIVRTPIGPMLLMIRGSDSAIVADRFDSDTRRAEGKPRVIARPAKHVADSAGATAASIFDAAEEGPLVYLAADVPAAPRLATGLPPTAFDDLAIGEGASRVAVVLNWWRMMR